MLYAVCQFPLPRMVCAEYFHSEAVVQATLIKVEDDQRYGKAPYEVVGWYYTLSTDQVFRGALGKTIRIYEENSSGRAPFEWKLGMKYVLFLHSETLDGGNKALTVDGCGNSGPMAQSVSVLRQIEQIDKHSGNAFITGTVAGYNLGVPAPGIHIEASGDGSVYKALTDRKGNLRIRVPAGKYRVRPVQKTPSVVAYDLSYDDPQDLEMQPGSCSQVMFYRRPNYP